MLFNEPKLLKSTRRQLIDRQTTGFSALQRAEIAEISEAQLSTGRRTSFSALQRAEIAEISMCARKGVQGDTSFSALQRAEIAEIVVCRFIHC